MTTCQMVLKCFGPRLLGRPLGHWLWHVNTHLEGTCGPCLLTAKLPAVWSSRRGRGGGARHVSTRLLLTQYLITHTYIPPRRSQSVGSVRVLRQSALPVLPCSLAVVVECRNQKYRKDLHGKSSEWPTKHVSIWVHALILSAVVEARAPPARMGEPQQRSTVLAAVDVASLSYNSFYVPV